MSRDSRAAMTAFRLMTLVRKSWAWLRQVSGDAAYENYLRCAKRKPGVAAAVPAPTLSRAEFYLDSLRRRYSTASRCC